MTDETPPRAVVPTPAPPHAARLVVVESVYHAVRGKDPTVSTIRVHRLLESDEQLYSRTTKLGVDWEAVNTGWVKDPTLITISVPRESKVGLEVGVENPAGDGAIIPFSAVPIGESIRITPITLAVFIRAVGVEGRVSINAYPR